MSFRFAGDALARSFALVARRPGAFASTQGLAMAAALLPLAALLYTAELSLPAPEAGDDAFDRLTEVAPLLVLLLASLGAAAAIATVAFGLGLVVADAAARGEPVDAFAAWDRLRPRFANLLLTQGLVFLAVLGPLLVAGLLGEAVGEPPDWILIPLLLAFWVGTFVFLLGTSLSAPASVLEDRAPADNLRRSWELTRGEKGGVFWALSAFALLAATCGWMTTEILDEDAGLGILFGLAVFLLLLFAFTALLVQMHRTLRAEADGRASEQTAPARSA